MPTVTHPIENFSGRVANVDFANGKAETDNEGSLAYFRRHEGYKISKASSSSKSSARDAGGEEKPLEDRTVPQLKKYAADRGIDLGSAKKKDEVLEAIAAHEEPVEEEDADSDEE